MDPGSPGIVDQPSVEGHFRKKQTERFCVSGSVDLIDNERSAPGIDNHVYQTRQRPPGLSTWPVGLGVV